MKTYDVRLFALLAAVVPVLVTSWGMPSKALGRLVAAVLGVGEAAHRVASRPPQKRSNNIRDQLAKIEDEQAIAI